jgi:hypothetical protein
MTAELTLHALAQPGSVTAEYLLGFRDAAVRHAQRLPLPLVDVGAGLVQVPPVTHPSG